MKKKDYDEVIGKLEEIEKFKHESGKERITLEEFNKLSEKLSYKKSALLWFQLNLGKKVTSEELAQIQGNRKKGKPISHNIRRIFELRDEDGFEIENHKSDEGRKLHLKVDEWILLKRNPNPEKIRDRGVNKRIMVEVFTRDKYQCQMCGRIRGDDDPFRPGHKIKLHVGHIEAHKRKDGLVNHKELTADDFVTLCNVCNEGAKNEDFVVVTLLDRVKEAEESKQLEIYHYLKDKFN